MKRTEYMQTYRVAVIPGDGIGQEVIPAAIRTLEAAGDRCGFRLRWEHFPWGSQHYFDRGRMMPEDALDLWCIDDAWCCEGLECDAIDGFCSGGPGTSSDGRRCFSVPSRCC